ncbi:MAG TPA: diacylglycerol kinase family protein [Pyrinomonadaceae bacterium]|nr:diacylglycerol kinase family protein [Pyrinomonadaceae bacterium]
MNIDGSIQVIVNAGAGPIESIAFIDQLKQSVNGDRRWRISIAETGSALAALSKEAVSNNSRVVVAAGGDGTVNTVAGCIVGTPKILGVLPTGTLNHFAKDLRLPLDLPEAIETIARGNTAVVDVGEVNGHVFVNNSSLGLYPHIVEERDKQQRLGSGKWAAFLWAALSVLRRYPFVDVRLTLGGMSVERRTPFVFVGNNRYEMEGLSIGARAHLDGQQLSLYTTKRISRWGLFVLGLRALFRRLRNDNDFLEASAKEIWIHTRHRHLRVALDGEVRILTPPLHYRILPQSLRVIVPS